MCVWVLCSRSFCWLLYCNHVLLPVHHNISYTSAVLTWTARMTSAPTCLKQHLVLHALWKPSTVYQLLLEQPPILLDSCSHLPHPSSETVCLQTFCCTSVNVLRETWTSYFDTRFLHHLTHSFSSAFIVLCIITIFSCPEVASLWGLTVPCCLQLC